MADLFSQLLYSGLFSDLSVHYYRFFQRLAPEAEELVWLSGSLAVQAVVDGHSCLPLSRLAGQLPFAESPDSEAGPGAYRLPMLEEWTSTLLASPLVGGPESETALVLHDGRLYLRRYFDYERRLAAEVGKRALLSGYPPELIAGPMARLFPDSGPEVDWQKVAAATAALKRLCLITGGPGTGKTHTVVRIIALLQMLAGPEPLRIGLAAPTGKAASRLQEGLQAAGRELTLAGDIPLPAVQAQTIHRLLGSIRHSPYFRHHRERRLGLDLLIVDEVSMVDLALMTKLIEAMPDDGRLVLLGDKDQLSSVEAGRVLADLCAGEGGISPERAALLGQAGAGLVAGQASAPPPTPLQQCLVQLQKSYRFRADSGIGALAAAVLAGDFNQAKECLALGRGVSLQPPVLIGCGVKEDEERLAARLCQGYGEFLKQREPEAALAALKGFQVLCAHRHGPNGSLHLNAWFEEILRRRGLIQRTGESVWYPGRPLMVTGNHYALQLFNGDLGVTLADANGVLRVYFEAPGGGVRAIAPARVPVHETAFSLTVHKSQGSEFDQVLLILPEKPSRLVSRELIYTAITRARQGFELWGREEVLAEGLATRTERDTGLQEWLRAGGNFGQ
jgi:exodeoxyribonuclease V alpha subunit